MCRLSPANSTALMAIDIRKAAFLCEATVALNALQRQKAVITLASTALRHESGLFESDTQQSREKRSHRSYTRSPCKEFMWWEILEQKGVLANCSSRELKRIRTVPRHLVPFSPRACSSYQRSHVETLHDRHSGYGPPRAIPLAICHPPPINPI